MSLLFIVVGQILMQLPGFWHWTGMLLGVLGVMYWYGKLRTHDVMPLGWAFGGLLSSLVWYGLGWATDYTVFWVFGGASLWIFLPAILTQ